MPNTKDREVSRIVDKIVKVQVDAVEPITRELVRYHSAVNPASLYASMSFEEQCAWQRRGYDILEKIYRGIPIDERHLKVMHIAAGVGGGYRGVAETIHATILACYLLVPRLRKAFEGDTEGFAKAVDIVIGGYEIVINNNLRNYSEVVLSSIEAAANSCMEKGDEFDLDYNFVPNKDKPDNRGLSLTARETDVLRLVGLGFENGEISTELHIAMDTTKGYVRKLLIKTGMHNRTQLALYAGNMNIVSPQEVSKALETSRES